MATEVFNSSQSWTCPAGVTLVTVECWGGGGGGGDNGYGPGGGGGAYLKKVNATVTPGNSYTVTVGTAGSGSTGNGTNGGDSGFNPDSGSLTAGGGHGTNAPFGGAGGTASG